MQQEKNNHKFHRYYSSEGFLDHFKDLFLHIIIPLIVGILISNLLFPRYPMAAWWKVIILIVATALSLALTSMVIEPLLSLWKSRHLYQLNKYLKTKQLYLLRSDWLKPTNQNQLLPRLREITPENYQYLIENHHLFDEQLYQIYQFHFNISKITGHISSWVNTSEWGVGKLKNHSLEIDKKAKLLKLDFTFEILVSIEAKLDIKNRELLNFEGHDQIIFDYKNKQFILAYFLDNFQNSNAAISGIIIAK